LKSIFYLSAFLLIVSFILTWATKRFSLKNRILDIPNERSSHSEPTPRGGGLAIVITWYIGITIMYIIGAIEKNLYFALISGMLLAVFSIIDDIIDLKPGIRIIAQTATVLLAFYFLNGIRPVILFNNVIIPPIILFPVAIIGMVWFINLYNFLDGIDGYASIEAIMVALVLFFFTGSVVNVILIVSVSGFLFWNWPKAKIFMGDVGSTQLGFIIAILGIYFHANGQFSIQYWILLLSPFWFDATLTLYRRWKNKEKLSQAHRKHIYQRLVQSGFSHLEVDLFLAILNSVLFLLVFLCRKWSILYLPVLVVTLTLLFLINRYTDRRKPF
jgi:UDP-N-acetylmuramyl pentapeptide phosphotransferase/UDP-N-acetylglucosamine-1-phosphate transferase